MSNLQMVTQVKVFNEYHELLKYVAIVEDIVHKARAKGYKYEYDYIVLISANDYILRLTYSK